MTLFAETVPATREPRRDPGAARRPAVVAFDLLQTLVSLDPLADMLDQAGLPDELPDLFFERVLCDMFALELGDAFRPFEEVARSALRDTLAAVEHTDGDGLVGRVVDLFATLPPHADARPAMASLRREGVRVVVLSHGGPAGTRELLARGGLAGLVEGTITAEETRHFRPARAAYLHAARALGTVPSHITLVSAHSWDVHGAKQAAFGAAWVRRHESAPSPLMSRPDLRAESLVELAEALLSLPVHA